MRATVRTAGRLLTAALILVSTLAMGCPDALARAPQTYRIVNADEGESAKNFPGINPAAPTPIVVDREHAGDHEVWRITGTENAYTIVNVGSDNRAVVRDGRLVGLHEGTTTWSLRRVAQGRYIIGLPGRNLVWTQDEDRAVLEPAGAEHGQLWDIIPVID
ncbi:RICIN domain-containing protein [Actinomadura chibensis]|uniref:RICIN domain-containing protein n=1 Tax=Actinomadura chibensis TaxID=392828 RepID=A0A5D0NVQ2_9ACTN|nr:hypothetical protein [Actinomadura chibensis]TYB48495.1 hypothetical protein FXF69_04695 [Actinomadura chibensis]